MMRNLHNREMVSGATALDLSFGGNPKPPLSKRKKKICVAATAQIIFQRFAAEANN